MGRKWDKGEVFHRRPVQGKRNEKQKCTFLVRNLAKIARNLRTKQEDKYGRYESWRNKLQRAKPKVVETKTDVGGASRWWVGHCRLNVKGGFWIILMALNWIQSRKKKRMKSQSTCNCCIQVRDLYSGRKSEEVKKGLGRTRRPTLRVTQEARRNNKGGKHKPRRDTICGVWMCWINGQMRDEWMMPSGSGENGSF